MSASCPPAPTNKKAYITDIGRILVKDYGKKPYYKPREVKKAHKKSSWQAGPDFSCWGMSTFSSHADFDQYHEQTGEVCDYAEMKAEMLQGFPLVDAATWMDLPDLDLDASWLDFGEIFGGILEGIGHFIAGIAEGL
jgi:hypothetical protein